MALTQLCVLLEGRTLTAQIYQSLPADTWTIETYEHKLMSHLPNSLESIKLIN